jgi:hypothetical protein
MKKFLLLLLVSLNVSAVEIDFKVFNKFFVNKFKKNVFKEKDLDFKLDIVSFNVLNKMSLEDYLNLLHDFNYEVEVRKKYIFIKRKKEEKKKKENTFNPFLKKDTISSQNIQNKNVNKEVDNFLVFEKIEEKEKEKQRKKDREMLRLSEYYFNIYFFKIFKNIEEKKIEYSDINKRDRKVLEFALKNIVKLSKALVAESYLKRYKELYFYKVEKKEEKINAFIDIDIEKNKEICYYVRDNMCVNEEDLILYKITKRYNLTEFYYFTSLDNYYTCYRKCENAKHEIYTFAEAFDRFNLSIDFKERHNLFNDN